MKSEFKIESKYLFLGIGLITAIVIPALWYLLSESTGVSANWVYLYMFASISMTFGIFGFSVGSSQDFLGKVLEKDNLTVLLNQKAFWKKAESHYSLGLRYKDKISVIMIDIDHFKQVNDSNNHLVGSAVLKEVGKIIFDGLRETDVAARYGGDEFIICLPRTNEAMAVIVAERLRSIIEKTVFKHKDVRVSITASFGISAMDCEQERGMEALVERADRLLYKAKESGRNQVVSETVERMKPAKTA